MAETIIYRRACPRISLLAQAKIIADSPFKGRKTNDEDARVPLGEFPKRDWIVDKKIRKGHGDIVAVTHFHRLAPTAKDLAGIFARIAAKGATVLEIATGHSTGDPAQHHLMIGAAHDFYAGRLTSEEASEFGKMGAAITGFKAKKGHMPFPDMDKILDDHTLSMAQAVARINADRRYKPVSATWCWRKKQEDKLHFRNRISGYGRS